MRVGVGHAHFQPDPAVVGDRHQVVDRVQLTRGLVGVVHAGHAGEDLEPQRRIVQQLVRHLDEAFAGDVVGIPNHCTLRIGDTLTEGEDVNFVGAPYFAPEILRRVRLDDAMKAKKLRQALQELAEEGVVQLFRPHDGSQPIVGVVGTLQLDVLQARLQGEYGVAIGFESVPYTLARWVSGEKAALARFMADNRSAMAEDVDGDPVYLASSAFMMRRTTELNPALAFRDIKDIRAEKLAA